MKCTRTYSVRVGNELGAAHPKSCKFSVIVVTSISLALSVILAILVLILRNVLSYAFTGGSTVADSVAELSPFLAFSVILNGVQPVLSGNSYSLNYLLCNGQLFKVRALPCKVVFRLLIFGFAQDGDVLTHTATQHNKQANEFITVCTSTQALISVAFL